MRPSPVRAGSLAASHESFQEFSRRSADWERLRELSGADPLFMGWAWTKSWWEIFGREAGAEWRGIVARDESGTAVGMAPLVLYRGALKSPFTVRRLGTAGGFFRGMETVLTQYTQLLGDLRDSPGILPCMLDLLDQRRDWSELVVGHTPRDSLGFDVLMDEAERRGWYPRYGAMTSYLIDTAGSFDDYCAALTPSIRRRLLHHRRRLERHGQISVVDLSAREVPDGLSILNQFCVAHRGRPALDATRLSFHRRVMEELGEAAVCVSVLRVGDRPVSVNYLLHVGDRTYGVAMGFDHTLDNSISLGTLHLGYLIESAFGSGVRSYDLMTGVSGEGNWKEALATRTIPMADLQLVRNRALACAYRAYRPLEERRRRRAGG